MLCSEGGSAEAEPDWFGCNGDKLPPLSFTLHNFLINAVHPKIAPLQHKIELNHLDIIRNWLEVSKKRRNIINILKDFSELWINLALSECYCAGWRYQDVTCELSALDIIFFQSLFHLDRCFCHCSQQAKFRCTFHCRSLLCTKSEARLLKH